MYTMTRNEYNRYVNECVNRMNTEMGYSYTQLKKDVESVEILPLDLSEYPLLSDDTKKLIDQLFTEETTDRAGHRMLRGRTYHETAEIAKLSMRFGDYSRNGSLWAYSDQELLLYTFCEGDTTLTLFKTEDEYHKAKTEMYTWYRENMY